MDNDTAPLPEPLSGSSDEPQPSVGRLPTWIMIGAMKSATSSMHNYLAEHPQIATSTPKELDFFIEPKFSDKGLDWYRRQFADPADAVVAGESSVNYTKSHLFPGVPERMHRHVPDAKLIYVLRDPFVRLESEWIHSVGAGKWRGDFASAVQDPHTSLIVQTSRYWSQLSAFLDYYDAEQIKIMSYDKIASDPHAAVSDFLEFIGLDPEFDHPVIGRKIHPSSRKMRPNRLGLLFWEDRQRRRRMRKYLRRIVASPIEAPVWDARDREAVTEVLRPEMAKIREFSGLDFPEWSI